MPPSTAQETSAMPAYKTIILEMLQEQPELYEQLRSTKRLLPTLDAYAIELKAMHEACKGRLRRARPGSDPSQVASEALELAIEELRDRLPCGSPKDEAEPISPDAVVNFLRRHTPPA
jgi:hypothetical protein